MLIVQHDKVSIGAIGQSMSLDAIRRRRIDQVDEFFQEWMFDHGLSVVVHHYLSEKPQDRGNRTSIQTQ